MKHQHSGIEGIPFMICNADSRSVSRVQSPDWWNKVDIEQDKLDPLPKQTPENR